MAFSYKRVTEPGLHASKIVSESVTYMQGSAQKVDADGFRVDLDDDITDLVLGTPASVLFAEEQVGSK